ncbi:prepilin-type N-terminal cleavage/methylation domain-containing protein [Paenibacillus tengchongensis]|uniref:prepilin-type N-terminal cleavage/methylation domain-containing protein n=1 Tax=Paenibacillus tengchongensis TaxID=2608684 RepID=UPI00124CDD94|nr:prepilin-type N-terminal cleavage/methylation domain-containing protein [Paenibacillus tengchongensis]
MRKEGYTRRRSRTGCEEFTAHPDRLRGQGGFTLIEVLAAIVILSIVSLVLTSYFTNAMSYSKSNQNKTIMVNLARNALFYMEKQDFAKMQEFFVTDGHTLSADECRIGTCGDKSNPEDPYEQAFNTEALAYVLHPTVNGINYSINVIYQKDLLEDSKSEETKADEIDRAAIRDYLLPVMVVVNRDSGGGPSAPVEVEGYISNEDIR